MTKIILKRNRGDGNPPAFYIIDRREWPGQLCEGFYVTEKQYATIMNVVELARCMSNNAELRCGVVSGNVEVVEIDDHDPTNPFSPTERQDTYT